MKRSFEYQALGSWKNARLGKLITAHGEVKTPVFMPVGTRASVKALTSVDLENLGAEIILANTYHLYLKPGDELVKECGGLHQFMRWNKPVLTDSGGYQVSSMGWFAEGRKERGGLKRTRVEDEGVRFWSHIDGSEHYMTPEKAIEIQMNLGSDIIMAFDEATPDKGRDYAAGAMERTHRWLERCKKKWLELEQERKQSESVLFGIVQGGSYKDLRRESMQFVLDQDLEGIAIGGGSIGRDALETEENVSWVRDMIPRDRSLYLMGVGKGPSEVVEAILTGADMFDCVAPTRLARMGSLYSGSLSINSRKPVFESEFEKERLNIDNSRFRQDKGVIDERCDCFTCKQGYSRAYLQHLFRSRELTYYRLASIHNVRFMIRIVELVREWLEGKIGLGEKC